jgi:hypothetical protein
MCYCQGTYSSDHVYNRNCRIYFFEILLGHTKSKVTTHKWRTATLIVLKNSNFTSENDEQENIFFGYQESFKPVANTLRY